MKEFTQALTKKEVCNLLKISNATLKNWLNKRYFTELSKLGYQPSDRILTPKQLNYLAEKIDLTNEK